MLRRFSTPVLLLLLPLLVFLAVFHPAVLDIRNAGWLIDGSDNGENALGAHAYWHDRGAGASLRTTLLNAPEGVPVLFTDSNPLVTLLAKPFAAWLPGDAQLVGPVILLGLILQAVFAWLLLRRHAPGRLALWCGVVLLAFPPTLLNRTGHANLMAHWTILAALCLFLDPVRGRRWRWWAALIAVTALIHSYLLILVGAIWASTMLARWIEGNRGERHRTIVHGAAMLVLVAMLGWWMGVGGQVASGFFGRFSMPLDALWNPGVPAYSTLLPAYERSAGRGFEGFQYLGAGGLAFVAAAIVVARRLPVREGERAVARRLRGLVPAMVVLAILAVARLPLSPTTLSWLDPIRASGRLFWPIGYVLILMALLAAFRLSSRRVGMMLAAIVALQVVDLSGMAAAIRHRSAGAGEYRLYARTRDARWDDLIRDARSVAFLPSDVTQDLALFQEVAWRAVDAGIPVANVYAARSSPRTLQRLDREAAAFARGALLPDRLYVLLPGVPIPPATGARIERIDGVTVIAPLARRADRRKSLVSAFATP